MKVTIYTTQGDQIHALVDSLQELYTNEHSLDDVLSVKLDTDPPRRAWIMREHVYLIEFEFDEPKIEIAEPEREAP